MVPVWLLDIDGVINAIGGSAVYQGRWPDATWLETEMEVELEEPWKFADGRNEVYLKVAQPVRDFIRDVHDQGLAEIRWHTTWREEAWKLSRWLGLPMFPIHHAPEYFQTQNLNPNTLWWKLYGANRVLADEGRPLLWTDDGIRYEVPEDSRVYLDPHSLIIAPDDRYGLSPSDLDQIRNYLEKEHHNA